MSRDGVTRRQALVQAGLVGSVGVTVGETTGRGQDARLGKHPMFGVDAANTGYSPDEAKISAPVTSQWRFSTDGGISSSPVVAGTTLYVGTDHGRVYALSSGSGGKKWDAQTAGPIRASPAATVDTVYVGSGDAHVYAFGTEDGDQRWRFETGGAVRSSPTVVDGTVYIGSGDQTLYALGGADGTEQWRFEADGPVHSSPAVADGTVYFTHDEGGLCALDSDGGTVLWEYTGADGLTSPVVADGTVYVVTAGNTLLALDGTDGTTQWTRSVGGDSPALPAVADGTVYVTGNRLYALAETDGTERWQYPASEDDVAALSDPASAVVAGERVYLGDNSGTVHAVDATDGTSVWTHETSSVLRSPPAVADEVVFLGGADDDIETVGHSTSGPPVLLTGALALLGPAALLALYGALRALGEKHGSGDEQTPDW